MANILVVSLGGLGLCATMALVLDKIAENTFRLPASEKSELHRGSPS